MNKYQEALNRIQVGERIGNEKQILQELVDKATPMKPIAYRECPLCDEVAVHETKKGNCKYFEYCAYCGQAIDWS